MNQQEKWAQVWAKKKSAEKRILSICPNIPGKSGIYIFSREENGLKFAYVGQAKDLKRRCAEHLLGYQHIDNSLKKHGLFDSLKNPNGYKLNFVEYPIEELDCAEQEMIKHFANQGYQLRNKTVGGQGEGKLGLDDHKPNKGYRDGLKQGYENARKEIREYFDKYLIAIVPENNVEAHKKNGEIKEVYLRKLNEFKEWLKGELKLP